VGSYIVAELLKTGQHTVTAVTRGGGGDQLPAEVKVAKVDYDSHESLVEALKGQDALIVTLAVTAPPDTESKLIEAAAAAGVAWIVPNNWGGDYSKNEALGRETMLGESRKKAMALIEKLGKSSYLSLVCGFWYEWSLAMSPLCYGFDFQSRKVTFYDDGNTKINTSTWPLCGLAVARLLSLKVLPEDETDSGPYLSQFRDGHVRISSFFVSQKDMFASALRVTNTKESDWTITYQNSKERYQEGLAELQQGNRAGYPKMLYARVLYPDGSGNIEAGYGLHNDLLGLPKEDLDECTKVAIDMALKGALRPA
jgi:hypothetical protein